MTPEEARELLIGFDGSARHAKGAGLTALEEIALVTKAAGIHDRTLERALHRRERSIRDALESARSKILAWHRTQAQDTLSVVENRPVVDRATFTDVATGLEVEIRSTQAAEDEKARAHPNLLPTAEELTAPQRAALSVVLDTR